MLLHHVLVRCGRVSAGGSGTQKAPEAMHCQHLGSTCLGRANKLQFFQYPNFANLITLWWQGACEESQLRF